MQLRYLEKVTLKVATKVKQDNGVYIDTYTKIDDYMVEKQELQDQVSASIYGADINKMLRLKSPNKKLEKYLIPKVNNKEDNISKYYIFIDETQYKIKAVTEARIDIERL